MLVLRLFFSDFLLNLDDIVTGLSVHFNLLPRTCDLKLSVWTEWLLLNIVDCIHRVLVLHIIQSRVRTWAPLITNFISSRLPIDIIAHVSITGINCTVSLSCNIEVAYRGLRVWAHCLLLEDFLTTLSLQKLVVPLLGIFLLQIMLSAHDSLTLHPNHVSSTTTFLLDSSNCTWLALFLNHVASHDSFLLHEVLKVHIVALKIFDQSLAFYLRISATCCSILVRSSTVSLNSTHFGAKSSKALVFERQDSAVHTGRKGIKSCGIWHPKLQCLLQRLLYSVVVTKSLPLRIDWVYWSTWEESLLDESLPINLVLVFLGWVRSCCLEDFNELTHCESGAWGARWMRALDTCVRRLLRLRIWYGH